MTCIFPMANSSIKKFFIEPHKKKGQSKSEMAKDSQKRYYFIFSELENIEYFYFH